MFPASTNASGMCAATVPDVCNTPSPAGPVPIPYPNMGQCTMATKTATKVTFCQRPVIHKMSEISMSSGDEAGVSGGVKSGTFIQKVTFMKGATKVKIEGQQCVYQTCTTMQNGTSSNTSGLQTSPSQSKVMVNG